MSFFVKVLIDREELRDLRASLHAAEKNLEQARSTIRHYEHYTRGIQKENKELRKRVETLAPSPESEERE